MAGKKLNPVAVRFTDEQHEGLRRLEKSTGFDYPTLIRTAVDALLQHARQNQGSITTPFPLRDAWSEHEDFAKLVAEMRTVCQELKRQSETAYRALKVAEPPPEYKTKAAQKMNRLLLLLLTAACATSAWGRLGESPAECLARYGKPTQTNKESKVASFEKNGFRIEIQFDGNTASKITYSKIPRDLQLAPNLEEEELAALLKANTGRSPWVENNTLDTAILFIQAWQTEDKTRLAFHDIFGGTLKIVLRTFHERQKKESEAQRQRAIEKNLKGF